MNGRFGGMCLNSVRMEADMPLGGRVVLSLSSVMPNKAFKMPRPKVSSHGSQNHRGEVRRTCRGGSQNLCG